MPDALGLTAFRGLTDSHLRLHQREERADAGPAVLQLLKNANQQAHQASALRVDGRVRSRRAETMSAALLC
eukprot:199979-Pleurochrysis_carterae.AAC.2